MTRAFIVTVVVRLDESWKRETTKRKLVGVGVRTQEAVCAMIKTNMSLYFCLVLLFLCGYLLKSSGK